MQFSNMPAMSTTRNLTPSPAPSVSWSQTMGHRGTQLPVSAILKTDSQLNFILKDIKKNQQSLKWTPKAIFEE